MDHTSIEILIASGYGVGIWAERLSESVNNPNLAFLKIEGEMPRKKFILAWKREQLTPEGKAYCRMFQ